MLWPRLFGVARMFLTFMFIAGLVTGSFLSLVAGRYRPDASLWHVVSTVFIPPSRCDHCSQRLLPCQLIPLLSFLWLRGRCSHCSVKLPLRLLYGELITGIVFVCCALLSPLPCRLVLSLSYCSLLILLAQIDYLCLRLPDGLTLPLLFIGILASLCYPTPALMARFFGITGGFLSLWLADRLYDLYYQHRGMGGGDMKLLAALGAWNGWQSLAEIVLLASAGTLAVLLLAGTFSRYCGKQRPLPFGVGLSLAGIVWQLWQDYTG